MGVLASYEIARGIKLTLGRVNNWVWGGFEGVLVGLGGSKRVCLTPIGHFLPLWKPCMAPDLFTNTTKWFKMAFVYRVGITDPFSDL